MPNGMCRLCGCFVEMRTVKATNLVRIRPRIGGWKSKKGN
ncbi:MULTISPECIES: DUF6171 family protein [Caproicibacterium]